MDGWNTYSEYRTTAYWLGACPATGTTYTYWTNWSGAGSGWADANQYSNIETNYSWEPWDSRKAYTMTEEPNWTLVFDWGAPHQGYFEKWTNYAKVGMVLTG